MRDTDGKLKKDKAVINLMKVRQEQGEIKQNMEREQQAENGKDKDGGRRQGK